MQSLNKAFVIVENYSGSSGYIQDFISFNKEELEKKCAELNKEKNDGWKIQHERMMKKRKNPNPFVESIAYTVVNLSTAIDNLTSMAYDENRTEDESY